jgi:hypothetical protein
MAISRGFYHAPAKPGLSATTGSFSWSLRRCAPSDPTRVQRRQVREGRVSDSCTRTLAYEPWLPSHLTRKPGYWKDRLIKLH